MVGVNGSLGIKRDAAVTWSSSANLGDNKLCEALGSTFNLKDISFLVGGV